MSRKITPAHTDCLPAGFAGLVRESLGGEDASVLLRALAEEPPPVSIRLNALKAAEVGPAAEPADRESASDATPASGLHPAGETAEGLSGPGGSGFRFPESAVRDLFPGAEVRPVPWCGSGFYLSHRPVFTLDPLFHAGVYYVQDASSMFLDWVREAVERYERQRADGTEPREGKSFWNAPVRVLDLCAAPGGKSTHLAGFLGPEGLLVCNEPVRSRAAVLAENMARWGAPNVMVTHNDPRDFAVLENYFDCILADVPCSGEGMFRKDPGACGEWSPELVNLCAARQRRILSDIWGSLRPGGYFVYSTCTYNRSENDGSVTFLREELGAEVLEVLPPGVPACGAVRTPGGGYQFIPGRVEGEGQYFALLRKPGAACGPQPAGGCANLRAEAGSGDVLSGGTFGFPGGGGKSGGRIREKDRRKYREKDGRKGSGKPEKGFGGRRPAVQDCPYVLPGYVTVVAGEWIKAYPAALAERMQALESRLRCISSGVAVARVKGTERVPHPDLALSRALDRGAFPAAELNREQALVFLSRGTLAFPHLPCGYLLVTYRNTGLGFVKNLGSRANNLYPQARRIRMDIG